MIKIKIIDKGFCYRLECKTVDGKEFSIEISKKGELLKKPKEYGLDESTAYFHIKHMIENKETMPSETTAAWG